MQKGLGGVLEALARNAFLPVDERTPSKPATQAAAFQPSQQIGASEPLGFFDPLSFTSEGDEQGFKKLRAAEIKHGRLSAA